MAQRKRGRNRRLRRRSENTGVDHVLQADDVPASAERGNLPGQFRGNGTDAVGVLEGPPETREITRRVDFAIQIVTANTHRAGDILQAAEPCGQESGGRQVVSPDGVVGMLAQQPIEKIRRVGHGGVPFAKAAHSIYRRISFFESHHPGVERSGPGDHVHLGADLRQCPGDTAGAGCNAAQVRRISFRKE